MKKSLLTIILIFFLGALAACGKPASKEEVSQRTSAYSTRLPSSGTRENAAPTQQSAQIRETQCFANKNMLRWRMNTTSAINYQIQLYRGSAAFTYVIYCENRDRCIPTMNGQSIEPNAYVSSQSNGAEREFEFSDNRAGYSENYGYRYTISAFSQSSGIMGSAVAVPGCTETLAD